MHEPTLRFLDTSTNIGSGSKIISFCQSLTMVEAYDVMARQKSVSIFF